MTRLYIETMQDILTHTPAVIVDDNLKGLLPLLPLTGAGAAPAPARPATAAPGTPPAYFGQQPTPPAARGTSP
jgi:hypothetical protein